MASSIFSSPLWPLVRATRPSPWLLGAALACAVLAAVATLGFPLAARQLVDQLAQGSVPPAAIALLAGVLAGSTAAFTAASYLLARVGHGVVAGLRALLVDKMLGLPVAAIDREDTGERVSRVLGDCEAIAELVTRQSINFLTGVLLLVGAMSVMFLMDVRLTLALLGCVAGAFLVMVPVSAVLHRLSRRVQDRTARLGSILTHVFSEIRLVKAHTAEDRERARCRREIDEIHQLGRSVARTSAALEPLMSLTASAAIAVILVYGTARVGRGDLSIGTLTAFILYIFSIANPLIQLAQFVAGLQKANGAASRIGEMLKEPSEEVRATPGATTATSAAIAAVAPARGAALAFHGVRFAYPDAGAAAVLRGIDLVFEPGTTTALVGASGQGKTTILSLIERFHEPSAGEIRFGGRRIAEQPLAAWRRRIGYVAQGAPIMPGSVRDNITYGLALLPGDEAVRSAAERAGAWTFIERMPQGLDTLLAEQGHNLSGGQRQRIAIARLFLRDPDILILDEATSNLDGETEHHVRQALATLMRGRTNIIVAHRLSTVVHADRIYFLEGGRISGAGNHAELVATHPQYARLVTHQFIEPEALVANG
jgi:ATP-binding cassette subfamily B protein AbcA/BmrA